MNCYNHNHKSKKDNEAMLSKCSCDVIRFELLFLYNFSLLFSSDKISKIFILVIASFFHNVFNGDDKNTDYFFVKLTVQLLTIIDYSSI